MPQGRVSANSVQPLIQFFCLFFFFLFDLPDWPCGRFAACKRIVEDTVALIFSLLLLHSVKHDVAANVIAQTCWFDSHILWNLIHVTNY